MEVKKFLKAIESDSSILGRMQRIPDGTYDGKLLLVDESPVCEIVAIPNTDFKRAFVRMNLTHNETGDKEKNVEVGYNSSLIPILKDEKHWSQEFGAKTDIRKSKTTKNKYQVVLFQG